MHKRLQPASLVALCEAASLVALVSVAACVSAVATPARAQHIPEPPRMNAETSAAGTAHDASSPAAELLDGGESCDAYCRRIEERNCLAAMDQLVTDRADSDNRCWQNRGGPCTCTTLDDPGCKGCLEDSLKHAIPSLRALSDRCKQSMEECRSECLGRGQQRPH
jgi:hypothetical protein